MSFTDIKDDSLVSTALTKLLTLELFVDIKAVNTCPLTVKVELTTKFPVITTLPSVVVFPTICSLLSEVGLSIPIPTLPVFTIFIIR